MPRENEDAPNTIDPDVLDRGLSGLLDLVGRTPGWEVDPYGDGHRILGGAKPIILPGYVTSGELVALKAVLAGDGWSEQAARDHIAEVAALYEEASRAIPQGGYPKEDRIINRVEARQILAFVNGCGCNSRPLKPKKIKLYSEIMDRGEWEWLHPQGLIFSKEHGCLLDGRNRLVAMLKSALDQMGFVTINKVPIEVFKKLDQGANRSIGDILAGRGYSEKVRSKLGAAVRLAVAYDSGKPWKSWRDMDLTGPQVDAALEGPYNEMPGKPYNDALSLGWSKRNLTGCHMLPAVASTLSFVVRRDYPDAPWEDFRTALVYGDNLPRGDARAALRTQLTNRDRSKRSRYEPQLQLGQALTAWRLWLNEVPVQQIKFDETMEMPAVWQPGMPIPGGLYGVRMRKERFEARLAKEMADLDDEG